MRRRHEISLPLVRLSEAKIAIMTSTDDEHEIAPKSDPAWARYEKDVLGILDEIDDSTLSHNEKLTGKLSGTGRQIDVLIEGSVAGSPITIVVECKHYAKPLGIGKIDEFAGKLADLQAERGILYALNGLTGPARARADGAYPSIDVRELAPTSPPPRPWSEYISDAIKLGDCANPNCIGGDVSWADWPQPDGSIVRAGACWACGTHAVECDCGEISSFFTDSETCAVCGACYELERDSDALITSYSRTNAPIP